MWILFLPPIINENLELIEITDINEIKSDRIPQISIKRIHKSSGNSLIIYEIEPLETQEEDEEEEEINKDKVNMNNKTDQERESESERIVSGISSQSDVSYIKNLYSELNYQPINELLTGKPMKQVNIFGIVLKMSSESTVIKDDFRYSSIFVYDFDINRPINVKLWRGLSVWTNSLSIGCKIQIRSLLWKTSELHSSSSSEIYLLGHGHLESGFDQNKKLSNRVNNLSMKELEILAYLNHQSLLIRIDEFPSIKFKEIENSMKLNSLKLHGPFYVEHENNLWTLEGSIEAKSTILLKVRFKYIDAKIWQNLMEIVPDSRSSNHELLLDKLFTENSNTFEFINISSLQTTTIAPKGSKSQIVIYKQLNWNDLISARVILYGLYEIEGILEYRPNSQSNESLGNLSILPAERSVSLSSTVILKCPTNDSMYFYPDNSPADIAEAQIGLKQKLLLSVRTVLNDAGNVDEIIRKSIFIM